MSTKLFGTDGVRGIANSYPLTVDFCLSLGKILGSEICRNKHKAAIARDTRISGSMLFSALCAGLTSQGIDVIDLGIIPTPLCTTLTPQLGVDMSIMITASHNPYKDNGLKLIAADGSKFSDSQTKEIEEKIALSQINEYQTEKIGKVIVHPAGLSDYIEIVKKLAPNNALSKMRIVLDSANGAFSSIMPEIFKNLGAEIISLSDSPNGTNINENCGSQHTENLCKTVTEKHFDLGIAVDGDGDRIIICDEKGTRTNGDQIIAFLTTYLKKHNLLKANAAVATIYSNLGLGKYIKSLGVDFYATPVGERYVIEKMQQVGANIGGEESGHMVLSDYCITGDALIASIVVALGVKEIGQPMSRIFPIFAPFPCAALNFKFANKEQVEKVYNDKSLQTSIAEIQNMLGSEGSLIVRKSGTEPVIRIKIEHEDENLVNKCRDKINNCISLIS